MIDQDAFLLLLRKFARRDQWCGRPATMGQLRALGMVFNNGDLVLTRPERLAVISRYIDRTITTTKDLSRGEANALLQAANSATFAAFFRETTLALKKQVDREGIPDEILGARSRTRRGAGRRAARRSADDQLADLRGDPVSG